MAGIASINEILKTSFKQHTPKYNFCESKRFINKNSKYIEKMKQSEMSNVSHIEYSSRIDILHLSCAISEHKS